MMDVPISIAIVLIMVSVMMGIAVHQGGLNNGDMFQVHFVETHRREKLCVKNTPGKQVLGTNEKDIRAYTEHECCKKNCSGGGGV